MSINPLAYSYSRDLNLLTWINQSIPQYVCRVPTVYQLSGEKVPMPTIVAVMNSIAETWELARCRGIANVSYCSDSNTLKVRPGRSAQQSKLTGQIGSGLLNTQLQQQNLYSPYTADYISHAVAFKMYGVRDPYRDIGYRIITSELEQCLCDYISTCRHIVNRLATTYGSMVEIGGVDTNDVPLLAMVQDRLAEDWERTKHLFAPEGSKLSSIAGSLADLERILRPTQEAISAESGVPMWLLFPEIVSSQYQLEERDVWASGLFERVVMPILLGLLGEIGYQVIDVVVPSYRDQAYREGVINKRADTNYKDSSTEKNDSTIAIAEENQQRLRDGLDIPKAVGGIVPSSGGQGKLL